MSTTSPVTTVTDELLAELEDGAKGASHWNLDACFQIVEEGYLPDEWYWHIGHYDEGNQYPVLLVDTDQYDAPPEDAKAVARHYANCGSRKITAIVAELRLLRADNAELAKDAGRLEWMISEQCIMRVQNGTGSPLVYSLWWSTLGEGQINWHKSARDAIDAAMQADK